MSLGSTVATLVPDGVSSVTATDSSGNKHEVDVQDNVAITTMDTPGTIEIGEEKVEV